MRGWRRWQRRLILVAAIAVAVFVAFEVGVRLAQPDAVQYETRSSIDGGPVTIRAGTVTDSVRVAKWRAAMTAQSGRRLLPEAYVHAWLRLNTCAPLGYYAATYRFTWHGLPVEVVSPAPSCGYGLYEISSGGLTDPRTYLIDIFALQHS